MKIIFRVLDFSRFRDKGFQFFLNNQKVSTIFGLDTDKREISFNPSNFLLNSSTQDEDDAVL